MDRNVTEMSRAFAQTLTRLTRDVARLNARVGSTALVSSNVENVTSAAIGAGAGTGVPATLLTVNAQPGKWYVTISVRLTATPATGAEWVVSTRFFDRATGDEITLSATDARPEAAVKHQAATATSSTLTGVGWIAVEPSAHPDGFSVTLDVSTSSGASWPTVEFARVAMLPF